MELQLNGKPFQTNDNINVSDLLDLLKLNPQQVVVELNNRILIADQLSETKLAQGDTLEIVQFVGGG